MNATAGLIKEIMVALAVVTIVIAAAVTRRADAPPQIGRVGCTMLFAAEPT